MGTGSRDRICHAGSSLGRHDRGRCQPLAPGAFLSQLVMLNARADTRDAPHFVHSFPLGGSGERRSIGCRSLRAFVFVIAATHCCCGADWRCRELFVRCDRVRRN